MIHEIEKSRTIICKRTWRNNGQGQMLERISQITSIGTRLVCDPADIVGPIILIRLGLVK